MTSVLNAIVKLPRYVRILATNQIDSTNAVVEDKQQDKKQQRNPDKVKKTKHAYYVRNKEKLLDYYHKYYRDNRESILIKKKVYNDKNKEQIKEYHRKYYQEHNNNKKNKLN